MNYIKRIKGKQRPKTEILEGISDPETGGNG
jgi:hypothetical protein